VNQYGCDVYSVDGFYINGTKPVHINHLGNFFMPICTEPSSQPIVSILIFISFVIIVGFVLMSLTIAAVTAGISERLDSLQREELKNELSGNFGEESTRLVKQNTVRRLLLEEEEHKVMEVIDPEELKAMIFRSLNIRDEAKDASDDSDSDSDSEGDAEEVAPYKDSFKSPVKSPNRFPSDFSIINEVSESAAPSTETSAKSAASDNSERSHGGSRHQKSSMKKHHSQLIHGSFRHMPKHFMHMIKTRFPHFQHGKEFKVTCKVLTSHIYYNYTVNFFVMVAALFELQSVQSPVDRSVSIPFNAMLQFFFSIDLTLKIFAHTFEEFWKKDWNKFDFAIVLVLWIPLVGNFSGLLGRVLGEFK
jgi:hypothetical protein